MSLIEFSFTESKFSTSLHQELKSQSLKKKVRLQLYGALYYLPCSSDVSITDFDAGGTLVKCSNIEHTY